MPAEGVIVILPLALPQVVLIVVAVATIPPLLFTEKLDEEVQPLPSVTVTS